MVESTAVPTDEKAADEEVKAADGKGDSVEVQSPTFEQIEEADSGTGLSLDRFRDVTVRVSANLGNVSMSLGELVRLGEGAVVKLDRSVTAPVDLVAQGVRVARGEVVVVDDCFAVRITEIESRKI